MTMAIYWNYLSVWTACSDSNDKDKSGTAILEMITPTSCEPDKLEVAGLGGMTRMRKRSWQFRQCTRPDAKITKLMPSGDPT